MLAFLATELTLLFAEFILDADVVVVFVAGAAFLAVAAVPLVVDLLVLAEKKLPNAALKPEGGATGGPGQL